MPGLTIATPHNKLWLILAFFLLKILCFTLNKDRTEAPSNLKSVRTAAMTSVCTEHKNFNKATVDQSGKQGKRSPCSPTLQNSKGPKSAQPKINPTTLGIPQVEKRMRYHCKWTLGPKCSKIKHLK